MKGKEEQTRRLITLSNRRTATLRRWADGRSALDYGKIFEIYGELNRDIYTHLGNINSGLALEVGKEFENQRTRCDYRWICGEVAA